MSTLTTATVLLAPVSYTHLDVYKRQIRGSAVDLRQLDQRTTEDGYMCGTDVYKIQRQNRYAVFYNRHIGVFTFSFVR